MSAFHKFASEVVRGDTVVREDGKKSKVTTVERGWIPGSLFLGYRGDDWSCVAASDLIEVRKVVA